MDWASSEPGPAHLLERAREMARLKRALQELQARKYITFRQHRESFVIWEGSDLDIDELAQAGSIEKPVGFGQENFIRLRPGISIQQSAQRRLREDLGNRVEVITGNELV